MLVIALEANADVPQMDVIIERLRHEERKQKDQEDDKSHTKALTTATYSRGDVKCYHNGKTGHIKPNCPSLASDGKKPKQRPRWKNHWHKVNKASGNLRSCHSSDSETEALMVSHAALQACSSMGNWIIDSGATCHMYGSKKFFVELQLLSNSQWR